MSDLGLTAWLLIASLGLVVFSAGLLFAVALVAAPRGVTTGPAVAFARLLFVVIVVGLALAVVALVWGLVTSWA